MYVLSLALGELLAERERLKRGGRPLQGRQGQDRDHDLHPPGGVRRLQQCGELPRVLWAAQDGQERLGDVPGRPKMSLFTITDLRRRFVQFPLQGVETASQIRYVTYYEKLKLRAIKYPEEVWVKLQEINISGELI